MKPHPHRTVAILCLLLLGQTPASAENPAMAPQASKPSTQIVEHSRANDDFFADYQAFYKRIYSCWQTPRSEQDWKQKRGEGSKKLALEAYQQKEKSPICAKHALLLLPYMGLLAACNKGVSKEICDKLLDKNATFPKDISIQQQQELLLGLNRVRYYHVNQLVERKSFDEIVTFNKALAERQWYQQLQACVPARKFLLKDLDPKPKVSIYVTLPSQWCRFDDLMPQMRAFGVAPASPDKRELMMASLESLASSPRNVEYSSQIDFAYCSLADEKERAKQNQVVELCKKRGKGYGVELGKLTIPLDPVIGKLFQSSGAAVLSTSYARMGQVEGFLNTCKQPGASGPVFRGLIGNYIVIYVFSCQGPLFDQSWKQYGSNFLNSEIALTQNGVPASKGTR